MSLPALLKYSIDVQSIGNCNYIRNLNIVFKGKAAINHPMNPYFTYGKAVVQIVNSRLKPESLLDYIKSLINYPKEMYDQLRHLFTAIEFINPYETEFDGTIAVLNHIELFNQNRGKNLSKPFLSLILQALKEKENVDYVVLQPFPVGMDVNNKLAIQNEIHRLEKLYLKMGFQLVEGQLPNEDYTVHFMYFKLSDKSFDEITTLIS